MIKKILNKAFGYKDKPVDTLASYIDLETDCLSDRFSLVCKGGGKLTLFNINGIAKVLGDEEFDSAKKSLLSAFTQLFGGKGVKISWMHEQDKGSVNKVLKDQLSGAIASSKRVKLKASDIFLDVINGNNKLCQPESQLLAIWTDPNINVSFSGASGKPEMELTPTQIASNMHRNKFKHSGNPMLVEEQLTEKHLFNVDTLETALKNFGCIYTKLSNIDALKEMSDKLSPSERDKKSTFSLYSDRNNTSIENHGFGNGTGIDPQTGEVDISSIFPLKLSEQLAKNSIYEESEGILKTKGRYYAVGDMTIFPRRMVRFNALLKNIKNIPCRITYHMTERNPSVLEKINESLINFGRAQAENKKVYDDLQYQLAKKEKHGIPQVNLQIIITTWGSTKAKAEQALEMIGDALSDWGDSAVALEACDTTEAFVTGIPGLSRKCTANDCWISADNLAHILPHQRAARIWERGGMIFRNEHDVSFPFQPQSDKQDYDFTIFIAPPRQGKSLAMNSKVIAGLFQEGAVDLNLAVFMDVGPTSAGAIQIMQRMIREKYGDERSKELACSHRWDPDSGGWSVNPCDIRFGTLSPANHEFEFMKNFYVSVCSEPESGMAKEGTSSVISQVILSTFGRLSHRNYSKKYNASYNLKLNESIRALNLNVKPDETSMYKLRDMLFQKGDVQGALIAHRLAMPTVANLIDTIQQDQLLQAGFANAYPGLLDYIAVRLSESISTMKYLSQHTTLNLQDAAISSFDMKPVALDKSPAGVVKTFAQYLVAMHISMDKFFLSADKTSEVLNNVPELYKQYWLARIKKYSSLKKTLTLDEWHTLTVPHISDSGEQTSKSVDGAAYIEFLIKEAPKWGVSLNMASHRPSDFTDAMLGLATNLFIFSGAAGKDIADMTKRFGLSKSEQEALEIGLHGPKEGIGNEILYRYKANVKNSDNSGMYSARIKFLCVGTLLWGLNTSSNDMAIKLKIAEEYPNSPWLEALINIFPSGSMKSKREELIKLLQRKSVKYNDDDDLNSEDEMSVEEELELLVRKEIQRIDGGEGNADIVNRIIKKNDALYNGAA